MKLKTEISDCGRGDVLVVGNADLGIPMDDQLEHDAASAHALLRELNALHREAKRRRSHEGELTMNLVEIVLEQATRQLTVWGFKPEFDGTSDPRKPEFVMGRAR